MSDFSPFEGKTLRGWPVATIKAGEIVARDGKIVGKPTGRYLPREAKTWRRTSSGFAGRRDGHACGDGAGPAEAISPLSICQVA